MRLVGLGDVDGDGKADYALGFPQDERRQVGGGSIRIVSGGSGTVAFERFGTERREELGFLLENAGDVDGDGRNELLVAGRPTAGDRARIEILAAPSGIVRLAFDVNWPLRGIRCVKPVGDADGDGRADFLVLEWVAEDRYRMLLRAGADGRVFAEVEAAQDGAALGAPMGAAGDVDGDGRADVYATTTSSSLVLVSRAGVELAHWRDPVGAACAIGDVDGDGCGDLAVSIDKTPSLAQVRVQSGSDGRLL